MASLQIYSLNEFANYLASNNFSREVKVIQNHHTWRPDYSNMDKHDEMYWLESMRNIHVNTNKWADIGQNLTTFRSGNIGLCRPINIAPAGIAGANTGAICIEHLGNFDKGKDIMTPGHRETIITLNALLCKKFGLAPVKSQIVYHHWYDRSGKRFAESKVNDHKVGTEQKTCPGTGFFGGNTIADAENHFFPLIAEALQSLTPSPPTSVKKKVNAGTLNVRKGPGAAFPITRQLSNDTEVSVYADKDDWSKISNTSDEWVFSKFLK